MNLKSLQTGQMSEFKYWGSDHFTFCVDRAWSSFDSMIHFKSFLQGILQTGCNTTHVPEHLRNVKP